MDRSKQAEYFIPKAGESVADFRERLAQREAEALESHRREIAEQKSDAHAPAARIRIWERLHQVTLPRNPGHSVLRVIAAHTGLTLEEVRAEQLQRTAAKLQL